MTTDKTPLVLFLENMLDERRLSQRAFGMYAGVASSTVSRIMNGGEPDPDTLIKFAAYLKIPIANLFQLAGWLPEDGAITPVLREIEDMLRELSESEQRKIRDQIRVEWEYNRNREEDQVDDPPQAKAS